MQSRTALILGGAGFIGTHLARQLSGSGRYARIMSMDIEAPRYPVPKVIYNRHDVREPIPRTFDGNFDVVYNLAAVHRTPGHPDCDYYDTNVAGATNCVAFCERNGIDTIFFTSSIAVYGPSESALDEMSPLRPVSAYGRSKKLAEEIHEAWWEREPGRRLRIVRPAVVFGQGESGNFSLLARMLERGLFVYPGRKDTRKAGGYVKELVRTMLFALVRPEPFYRYNFADQAVPTSEDICKAFIELGGFKPPIGVAPRAMLDLAALGFEALNALGVRNKVNRQRVAKLINSTNIVPRQLIEDGYPFAYTLKSALNDWIASDEELRPHGSRAHAVIVPPLGLAHAEEPPPATTAARLPISNTA
jgi:nucleoside-diphosphate-sugar epimerase